MRGSYFLGPAGIWQKKDSFVTSMREKMNLSLGSLQWPRWWRCERLGQCTNARLRLLLCLSAFLTSDLGLVSFLSWAPCMWRLCDHLSWTGTCPGGVRDFVRTDVSLFFPEEMSINERFMPPEVHNPEGKKQWLWNQRHSFTSCSGIAHQVTLWSLGLLLCRIVVTASIQQCCWEDYCKWNHI